MKNNYRQTLIVVCFMLDMLDFPRKSLVNYKRQVKAYLALNINPFMTEADII